MQEVKEVPRASEMERLLLGMLLLKGGAKIPVVSTILTVDDFFHVDHQIIYSTILELYAQKITPDFLTLIEELRRTKNLDKVGVGYLTSLSQAAFTTAHAEEYARIIKQKSLLRQLIKASEEIARESYADEKPVEEILDEAERKIFNVTAKGGGVEIEELPPILQRAFERIQLAAENNSAITGIATKFDDLDELMNGLQNSDLILIAARPSMGKTAFALNVALNASLCKKTVALFSLEMSKEQLADRLLSSYTGIDSSRLKTGKLDVEEMAKIALSIDEMNKLKFFVDDTAAISVMELRSKVRRLKTERGLDLIVIDYLQLMQGKVRKGSDYNRQQEVSEISRSLKALARELKIPVVALSQLSRNTELRADKRPLLSDLRESGSLEQDADIVMFLYRDEYYNAETELQNIAEVIVAKNRNGATGKVHLHFNKECTRFNNVVLKAGDYDES